MSIASRHNTEFSRAAKTLLKQGVSDADRDAALAIVGDWRAAHRYPLHAIMMSLRTRARHIDASSIVVQRSKRLASILPKLERIRLTQIQDIGGCRAIFKDLGRLNKVHKSYMDRAVKPDPRRSYMEGDPDNYIDKPKADGYRSIHYVFRYRSELKDFKCFEGMKIEVQLRTRALNEDRSRLRVVQSYVQLLGSNAGRMMSRRCHDGIEDFLTITIRAGDWISR